MSEKIKIIAGLGNPGTKYIHTRHNAGFDIIEAVAQTYSININKKKFNSLYSKNIIENKQVILVKPTTYMNLSGFPIKKFSDYYNIKHTDIIIIHDDIDLLLGRIKIKEKGGDGGHKGVRSIIDALGDNNFIRVRFGVGRPETEKKTEVSDYVLKSYDYFEKKNIKSLIDKAKEAAISILLEGVEDSMNYFNRK